VVRAPRKHPAAIRLRAEEARARLAACDLCPRRCGVNRLDGKLGVCRIGAAAAVASAGPHFGEEAPLVGRRGSGTIFFVGCNLRCVFCQNFDISHDPTGARVGPRDLAAIMIRLQDLGCHNINLVTPSHVVPQILDALADAIECGLHVPIVYNTSGYDAIETLKLLEGVVDIYMPDLKAWSAAPARAYLTAADYPLASRAAIREMHRQVGDLEIGPDGVATRGLLVRHLVMPDDLAGTGEVMRFLAREISAATYVNVMDQYRPAGVARAFPAISRGITGEEFAAALRAARGAGLSRLDPGATRFRHFIS